VKYYKLLFFLLLTWNISYSQHQEREVLLYNIGLGGFASGVGAIINTPKGGNWKQNFVTSFWQGTIGGILHYTGKKTLYLINEKQQLLYAWPARFQHAAGSSIIQNAAMNKPFLRNWNMVVGPVRFDYSTTGVNRFRLRLLPTTIYAIAAGCYSGDLNMNTSLLVGDLAFKSYYSILPHYAGGLSYGRGFSYIENYDKYHTIAHELVHEFQYEDYQFLNSYSFQRVEGLKNKKVYSLFRNYIYFDVPYFLPFYFLGGKDTHTSSDQVYGNFYEFEAERFATNNYVKRH
jgi:hypothetical protein